MPPIIPPAIEPKPGQSPEPIPAPTSHWASHFVGEVKQLEKVELGVALAPTPDSNEVSLREASGKETMFKLFLKEF
ncbi:MAG: hypothetical protein WCI55_09265 [Armatimonadota bacterium]